MTRVPSRACWALALLLVSPLTSLGLGETEAKVSWNLFRSERGRFQVEVPGVPTLETRSRSTLFGAVRETKYKLRFGDAVVAVEVHDFPAVAVRLVSSETILAQVQSGVLEDMGATQIDSTELEIQGAPARDFTYRVPVDPLVYERALAVLVGSRIYIVTGLAVRTPESHPGIERFFASFRFWEAGEEPGAGENNRGS